LDSLFRSPIAVVLSALVGTLVGCATSEGPYPINFADAPPIDTDAEEPLRLEPGAELELRFYYTPELNQIQFVRPDGKIAVELIGDVQVAGRTPEEVREELQKRLSQRFVDPQPAVLVRTLPSRKIFVGGEVKKPGILEMPGTMSLLESVLASGGPDFREGDIHNVVVVREQDNKRYGYLVDLGPALAGEEAKTFRLRPRDMVFVPRTGIAKLNQWILQHIDAMVPNWAFAQWPVGTGNMGVGRR